MRRLLFTLFFLVIAASPAGIIGASVAAQGSPDEVAALLNGCLGGVGLSTPNPDAPWNSWEGVCQPIAESEEASIPTPADQPMQPYAVGFQMLMASTIPIGVDPIDQELGLSSEFMVIYVREGTFAVDVEEDPQSGVAKQVVVSTLNESIPTLKPWNESLAISGQIPYEPTDAGDGTPIPLQINGELCTRACPVDPDEPVALGPGDLAIAEEGALCYACLIANGQIADNGVEGLLEVYVLKHADEFSWDASWIAHQQAAERKQSDAMTGTMGWGYFNPPSGCH